jgi:hypothetical protein
MLPARGPDPRFFEEAGWQRQGWMDARADHPPDRDL